jgi:hypothetical protein
LQGIKIICVGRNPLSPKLKLFEQKIRKGNFGNVTRKCSSTTDDASVALLFIAAENDILNDFQFLGCFIRSNYPLHITIRCINSQGV